MPPLSLVESVLLPELFEVLSRLLYMVVPSIDSYAHCKSFNAACLTFTFQLPHKLALVRYSMGSAPDCDKSAVDTDIKLVGAIEMHLC